ncbi:hypothetical protein [Ancylobacter radicis]|uniref:Uncharacterized protein n=1 Tax=Ancylobacter radicis TaxID=2836179 RepID=A0ABS5R3Y3_9HYPH|nr:hypothetical protein [Ancylobacter radicis]MBS9476182.1 hypothetical protein [Ancylobacter radicis]
MTALGGVLTIVVIWAMWAPREVGDYLAKVVDSYQTNRAALRAKREPKP